MFRRVEWWKRQHGTHDSPDSTAPKNQKLGFLLNADSLTWFKSGLFGFFSKEGPVSFGPSQNERHVMCCVFVHELYIHFTDRSFTQAKKINKTCVLPQQSTDSKIRQERRPIFWKCVHWSKLLRHCNFTLLLKQKWHVSVQTHSTCIRCILMAFIRLACHGLDKMLVPAAQIIIFEFRKLKRWMEVHNQYIFSSLGKRFGPPACYRFKR